MDTFISIVHVLTALSLIALVLVQDSKSGNIGGAFGGGSSNSVFGATGAATLAQKLTRYTAVIFAVTSISLSTFYSHKEKSVIDSVVTAPATNTQAPAAQVPEKAPTPDAAPATPAPTK